MARGPLRFRQSDLTRAIRAAIAAGVKVERVRIERDGKIVLDFAKDDGSIEIEQDANPFDELLVS